MPQRIYLALIWILHDATKAYQNLALLMYHAEKKLIQCSYGFYITQEVYSLLFYLSFLAKDLPAANFSTHYIVKYFSNADFPLMVCTF